MVEISQMYMPIETTGLGQEVIYKRGRGLTRTKDQDMLHPPSLWCEVRELQAVLL
jgi:hypothetical protein